MTAESDAVRAGELLRAHWASLGDPPEALEEQEELIRDCYVDVEAAEPDDVTGLAGMTLLAFAKLWAHVVRCYPRPLDRCEDAMWARGSPMDRTRRPTRLKGTDAVGRRLAEDAADTARIALDQRPDDNLAAFALARSLEWLGDRSAAVTAYREALAADPYDEAARSRLTILDRADAGDVPARPAPGDRARTRHPHGFYVMELTEPLTNSGDVGGVLALLNEPNEVRTLADDYLRGRADDDDGSAEWLDEMTLALVSNLPGTAPLQMDLREAVDPAGREIDWARVAMADPLAEPLPAGCPIRWRGELLFFGPAEF